MGTGDWMRLNLPGGGGHGDPHERSIEAIALDIVEGYVTAETARNLYGVKMDGDGTVTRYVETRQAVFGGGLRMNAPSGTYGVYFRKIIRASRQ